MLSHKLHMIIAPSMAISLMGMPLVLTGCGGNDSQDAPTTEDIEKAAREEQGGTAADASSGGGSGAAPAPEGGTQADEATYDENGNLVVPINDGGEEQTSADGSYATSDFTSGSAIYNQETVAITNQFQFVTDGIGTWEMVALKDSDGYVYAGGEINPTTMRIDANNTGVINANGTESAFGWQQYKDFPQLALGDIGKKMTLTMELNDNGMLTVRQDADGQMMLFQKASGAEAATDPAQAQPTDVIASTEVPVTPEAQNTEGDIPQSFVLGEYPPEG